MLFHMKIDTERPLQVVIKPERELSLRCRFSGREKAGTFTCYKRPYDVFRDQAVRHKFLQAIREMIVQGESFSEIVIHHEKPVGWKKQGEQLVATQKLTICGALHGHGNEWEFVVSELFAGALGTHENGDSQVA